MKPPSILRIVSRPTAFVKPYGPPKIGQIEVLNARRFTATPRRLFLDECLVQTHTFINGIHDMTGLPWAATIPLTALLVRVAMIPVDTYCSGVAKKIRNLRSHFRASIPALEKKIERVFKDRGRSKLPYIKKVILDDEWDKIYQANPSTSTMFDNYRLFHQSPDLVHGDGDYPEDDGDGGWHARLDRYVNH